NLVVASWLALALYVLTATALLWLADRFVQRTSRRAMFALVTLPLAFTGYAFLSGRVYAPIDHPYKSEPLSAFKQVYGIGEAHNIALTDVSSQMLPWRRAVQLSLVRGEWPLWNPYNLAGGPLAGNGQSAPYDPFTLLACLLPILASFTYSAAMTYFI